MNDSFYTPEELKQIGFGSFGEQVLISRKASFYSPAEIHIGNHVRIDDFCILSGKIRIGSYIHISAYVGLYGAFGIEICDYATISGRVMVYSQNDDYSGEYLTNPMVPESLTNVTGGRVIIGKYAIVGAGSVVLPKLTIGEGAAIGTLSLVKEDVDPWLICAGIPVKILRERSKACIKDL